MIILPKVYFAINEVARCRMPCLILTTAVLVAATGQRVKADEALTDVWVAADCDRSSPMAYVAPQPGLGNDLNGSSYGVLASVITLQDDEGDPSADAVPPGDAMEPLGRSPEDTSQLFLRTATVLLQPGDVDFDFGLRYTWSEALRTTIAPGIPTVIGLERVRNRELVVPFGLRFGLTRRIQGFVNAPAGFASGQIANDAFDEFADHFGIGDVTFGVTGLLRERYGRQPDVTATVSCTAPTGKHPFERSPVVAYLGSGFWAINADVGWIKSLDPAVIFTSLGYSHRFGRDFVGSHFQPGEEIRYAMGMGFAINDYLTLSTTFLGSYRLRMQFDGDPIPGSNVEPLAMRLALTTTVSSCAILEPFMAFGLTPDAPAAGCGIIFTRRF